MGQHRTIHPTPIIQAIPTIQVAIITGVAIIQRSIITAPIQAIITGLIPVIITHGKTQKKRAVFTALFLGSSLTNPIPG